MLKGFKVVFCTYTCSHVQDMDALIILQIKSQFKIF